MLLSFSPVSSSLDQHIVGLWLFDEGPGDTVHDSSNYGNDGEIEGHAEWVDGVFKKALSFNGKDAYVKVPNSDSLGISIEEEITIEFWFYPRSASEAEIVRKHEPLTYEVIVNADNVSVTYFGFKEEGAPSWSIPTTRDDIPFDKWTHLAFTYDGEKQVLYINGESAFERATPGKISTSNGPLYIGTRDGTRRFLDGILDELCIWNIARTADEIKAHVEEGFSREASIEKAGKLAVTWAALKRK